MDDFIEEKSHTTMNSLVCYHFDHKVGHSIKGLNILNFLLVSEYDKENTISIPVAFEPVFKPIVFNDEKTGKEKRKAEITIPCMLSTKLRNLI